MDAATVDILQNVLYGAGGVLVGSFAFWLKVRNLLRQDKQETVISVGYQTLIRDLEIGQTRMREELARSTAQVGLLREESEKLRETVVRMEVTVNSCKHERELLTQRLEAFAVKYGERRTDKPA